MLSAILHLVRACSITPEILSSNVTKWKLYKISLHLVNHLHVAQMLNAENITAPDPVLVCQNITATLTKDADRNVL